MKIKYLHVKNFKSFSDEIIELNNFNILLGCNSSGKSNAISIFRFINNIVQYGLEDAISLLGGIDYTVNANIGKKNPIYIKFILDISKEEWIRYLNRKQGYALWLDEITYEFEILPNKRGTGYRIGIDKLDILYKRCDVNADENEDKIDLSNEDYIITYEKKSNNVKFQITNNISYENDELKNGLGAEFITQIINLEAKEKKELILNKLDFMMPPMFTSEFIRIYDFDPKLMKKSSSITSKRKLEEDGSNIANVLQIILRNKTNKNKLLNLLNDCLPFVKQIGIQNNVDKSVSYNIMENYNNKKFYSNFLSDGTVNMLALIISLYFEKTSGIIILEEPERNLHPELMNKLVEMANEVSEERQVIMTTHNPELVKHSKLNAIMLAQRTEEGYTKITKPANSTVVQSFIESDLTVEDLFIKGLLGE